MQMRVLTTAAFAIACATGVCAATSDDAQGASLMGFLKRSYATTKSQLEREEKWKREESRRSFLPFYLDEKGDYSGRTLVFPLYWRSYDKSRGHTNFHFFPLLSGKVESEKEGRAWYALPIMTILASAPDGRGTAFASLPLLARIGRNEVVDDLSGERTALWSINFGLLIFDWSHERDDCHFRLVGPKRPRSGANGKLKYRVTNRLLLPVFQRLVLADREHNKVIRSVTTVGAGLVYKSEWEDGVSRRWLAGGTISLPPRDDASPKDGEQAEAGPKSSVTAGPFGVVYRSETDGVTKKGALGWIIARWESGPSRREAQGLMNVFGLHEREGESEGGGHRKEVTVLCVGSYGRVGDRRTMTLGPCGTLFAGKWDSETSEVGYGCDTLWQRQSRTRRRTSVLGGLLCSREIENSGYHSSFALTPLFKVKRIGTRRYVRVLFWHFPAGTKPDAEPTWPRRLTRNVADLMHYRAKRRVAAAKDLGEYGDARAVSYLVDALHDRSSEVRAAALGALVRIGDEACVPGVVALLRGGAAADRALAASALGDLGARSAVPALEQARSDPSKKVRQASVSALKAIGRAQSGTEQKGGDHGE